LKRKEVLTVKVIIPIILIFVGSLSASAQGWAWMGEYPYIWDCDAESWQYVMPCGDNGYYAYNYATDEWVTIGDVPSVSALESRLLL
jgi:hypothetical protein